MAACQRLRLVEVNARTGASRNLIDEQTETFIWTAHTEGINLRPIQWLEKSGEILYISERDGWRPLRPSATYLVTTLAHTILLWYGDILTVYAVLGFVLLLLRNRTNRTLLVWTAVLIGAVPVLMGAVPWVLSAAGIPLPVGWLS